MLQRLVLVAVTANADGRVSAENFASAECVSLFSALFYKS